METLTDHSIFGLDYSENFQTVQNLLSSNENVANSKKRKRIHDEDDQYWIKCDHCQHSFLKKADFCMHFQSCSSGKGFQCFICDKVISRKDNLICHYVFRHKNYSDEIEKLVNSTDNYMEELANVNTKYLKEYQELTTACHFKCNTCSQSYKYKIDFRIHVKFCLSGIRNDFQCDICKEQFEDEQCMIDHYKNIHPKQLSQFYKLKLPGQSWKKSKSLVKTRRFCDKCQVNFYKEINYILHKESCILNDYSLPKAVICHICKVVFSKFDKLYDHYRVHHDDFAKECLEKVDKSKQLEQEKISDINVEENESDDNEDEPLIPSPEKTKKLENKIYCPKCLVVFKRPLSMRIHYESCKRGLTLFCHICERQFCRSDKIHNHYKSAHKSFVKSCEEESAFDDFSINYLKQQRLSFKAKKKTVCNSITEYVEKVNKSNQSEEETISDSEMVENDISDNPSSTTTKKIKKCQKKVSCPKCHVGFTRPLSMRIHYESCKRGLTLFCHICERQFCRSDKIHNHYKSAHKSFVESCEKELGLEITIDPIKRRPRFKGVPIKSKKKSENNLDEEKIIENKNENDDSPKAGSKKQKKFEKKITCPKCQLLFTRPLSMRIHYESCKRDLKLVCHLCERQFCRSDKIFSHYKSAHKSFIESVSNELDDSIENDLEQERTIDIDENESETPADFTFDIMISNDEESDDDFLPTDFIEVDHQTE